MASSQETNRAPEGTVWVRPRAGEEGFLGPRTSGQSDGVLLGFPSGTRHSLGARRSRVEKTGKSLVSLEIRN